MQNKFGIEKVDQMINDRELANIKTREIEEKIIYYKQKVKEWLEKKNIAIAN